MSAGWGRVALVAVATVLLVVGVGAAFPARPRSSPSSRDTARAVARFCADADAMTHEYANFDDASAPAARQLGDLRQILSVYKRLAGEAPSAVHGDMETGATVLEAVVDGRSTDTQAGDAAEVHLQAWKDSKCH